jgi:hypothetical protein
MWLEKSRFLQLLGDADNFTLRIGCLSKGFPNCPLNFSQAFFAGHLPDNKRSNLVKSRNTFTLKETEKTIKVLPDFKSAIDFRYKLAIHVNLLFFLG